MSRHRAKDELREVTGINVTPLVDLVFLLLMVFIIMGPVLEYAVDISPPKMNAQVVEDKGHKIINLDRQGVIHLQNETVSLDALGQRLAELFSAQPDTQFYIRADESRPYGEVMAVMRVARHAGITKVALVTLAENER